MSTWLQLLTLELNSIAKSDIIEPDHAPENGDLPVGEMPDMARRLFSLGRLLEKDGVQCQIDAHYCNDKVKKLELEARCQELKAKSSVLMELMWIGIRDELGLWNENVGVRSGFKVVMRPDTGGDMPPFLKRLLGG